MVFTLEEFFENLAVNLENTYRSIDESLKNTGKANVNLLVMSKFAAQRDGIAKQIIALYQRAGWCVERTRGDSQKDGEWDEIAITIPKKQEKYFERR